VHEQPRDDAYGQVVVATENDTIELVLDGTAVGTVRVRDLLP
jgi:hypothetical protein